MNIRCFRYTFTVAVLAGALSAPASARNGTIREIGDVLQFAIPAAALASTIIADDPEGRV